MNWLMLAGSGAAVLVLGLVAWALKLGRKAPMMRSPEEAMRAAEGAMPGFVAIDGVVGEDGRAGLALGEDGRLVVVKTHGARAAARTVAWGEVRQDYDGLIVDTGERRFGRVLLLGVTVLDVRRLAPPVTVEAELTRV